MNPNDYQVIMKYYPPVNNTIVNPYGEADYSYKHYNSISPLKIPSKDYAYSIDIINDLRTLRILLNSPLTYERFIYELNKVYEAWGQYGRNILNSSYIDIYSKIKRKEQQQYELMQEASTIATEYDLGELEKQLGDFSLKPSKNFYNINDLNLSKLNLKKSIIRKKSKSKSKK